ncbi:MAG: hypothetical protein J6386_00525 [Candidatus Synoicihabitans palmerolidicus]|nr:hypothetical protein [Candidatus Synoicihabitans palmerolidicus]
MSPAITRNCCNSHFAILGAIDIFFFLALMLQVVAVYPMGRFRAALGAGFLGIFFHTQGNSNTALYAILGSAGIYFSTIFTNLLGVFLAAILGIGWHGALRLRGLDVLRVHLPKFSHGLAQASASSFLQSLSQRHLDRRITRR